jgi:hypothetical protein
MEPPRDIGCEKQVVPRMKRRLQSDDRLSDIDVAYCVYVVDPASGTLHLKPTAA